MSDLKAAPLPGQDRFCCNPKCKYHNQYVKAGKLDMLYYPKGGAMPGNVTRQYVTRTIEGVEISGPFCQVCMEVITMFNL